MSAVQEDDDRWPPFPPPDAYPEGAPSNVVKLNGAGAPKGDATALRLRPLYEIVAERKEAEWLLLDVLEREVLAVLAGPRGTFKSFVALHWAMLMALDGHPGVILSGEGAGLGRRVEAWAAQHRESLDIVEVPIVALEVPLNLTAIEDMERLGEAIARLEQHPAFIVIDTLSKFSSGMDENDNGEVAAFLSSLSEHLRVKFNCTVLLVAHSGHGDAARPRGASALMSNPDAEYIVKRADPVGMVVTVSRDRFKDTAALTPLSYEAKVMDLGRLDAHGRPVTSLALLDNGEQPREPSAKGKGRNQEKFAIALREWHRNHPNDLNLSSLDLDAMCKAQGMNRFRKRDVLDSFVNARILTLSVGGYILHPEHL